MTTLAQALEDTTRRLERAGVESAASEAYALLEALLALSRSELLLARQRPLSVPQRRRLEAWVRRREAREPLQHILGVAPFYGLTLRVTPQVLVPRPETERLVELALAHLRGRARPHVLDVGTGSGAVALALQAERPDAVVLASDLSGAALAVARENARRLGLPVRFRRADLLADPAVRAFARRAELVVSNPPYLPEGDREAVSPEVQADPATALYAGPDGLAVFRRLEREAFSALQPGAALFVELDARNVARALAESRGWARGAVHDDLVGRPRFLQLVR
ncbi:peptide chain release factor N(5)-glutamine methyltransferase [Truepera radiovictrix]|uniref:Release factor glutamine methyltransferase n=1 Tax=Truepera radiovictrix (strain DSM 17093 / CIP 108686 / LMG 22925 / RQ-24) TaxID=649638 RepID=D7CRN3_TRURR|nr:peptide chain release factor N(5)-glutamine methyltransferase [Truepera radiovictrix]ADI13523.1 protein-(glutamine-N5) methyltransferase, release factor-specific [Truepera radiovictrix DSM 17093]WMT57915.1 peptide chain release factor N(5)-glutamine methyltransferase [Truepera radiovictrix]